MNINLPVPLVLQEAGSVDCGLAGLSMLYGFYGMPKTIAELRKDLVVDEIGTYAPQLGRYMMKDGFKVEIITHHPTVFVKKDQGKSQSEVLQVFENLRAVAQKPQNQKVLDQFIAYLKEGGKVTVKIPTAQDILERLQKGAPVCGLVTSNFVHGTKAVMNYHFLIVRGVENGKFIVNDPIPDERGGVKEYTFEEFLYGLYASAGADLDNASLFIAYK